MLSLGAVAAPVLAQTAPAAASGSSTAPDIHDIHGLAPLTFWERYGTLITYSSIGSIVIIAVVVWFLLRKKPVIQLTPYEKALRELEAARALSGNGQHQAFAIFASDAVRHYLENAYQMPAPERTTEEFLLEAARQVWLKGKLAELLQRFLEFCDLAKFAGQELGEAEREQLLGAAREFLDAAEKLRQPPTATTPGTQKSPAPPVPPAKPSPASP